MSIELNRRHFIAATAAGAASVVSGRMAFGQDRTVAKTIEPVIENGIAWFDVNAWHIEGRCWSELEAPYDRLPAKAKGVVTDAVWSLGKHSAGMTALFHTDASQISVRYTLGGSLAMPHMPATGVSGIDLYGRDDEGKWRWIKCTMPSSKKVTAKLASGIRAGSRDYAIYLPLYNSLSSVEVGVPHEAALKPLPPRDKKPIVFYGTSIMQGGCVSRPGMSITGILGRRLDRPAINLGFSGNGTMDKAVGDLLIELDVAAFAIDCGPNMKAPLITERCEPLVRQLREAKPDTPILLVEDRNFENSGWFPGQQAHHEANHNALREAYDNLVKAGVKGLSYLPADDLLGHDGEATVDGSHPNDLGMVRYADAYEPILRKMLA